MATSLTRSDLQTLSQTAGPCVSIFLPTHRAGEAVKQDPIHFKNLLREAEKQLLAEGRRTPDVEALLQPAEALLPSPDFWRHQSDGLAFFLAPGFARHFRLPLNFERLLVIADRFHLKPLLPYFSEAGHFFILALSQNKVRLFIGTRHSIDPVNTDELPASLDETLEVRGAEKQLQWHSRTAGPGVRGKRAAVFHGQGDGKDITKTELLRYFRGIDTTLRRVLFEEQAPLLLAGVDYLLPLYREVNGYHPLLEAGLEGNPDRLDAEALHAAAWAVVQPIFQQAEHKAAERYRQLSGAGDERASADLRRILPAAQGGRVETLFVALGQQCWGQYDLATDTVQIHAARQPGDEDLFDRAALETYSKGGAVYAVPPERVPDQSPLAATFRYSV